MRLSIMFRTLRGKQWKSCLNWLVFLEQSLRAKFNLRLLTVAFRPGQQDLYRKRREQRGVLLTIHSSTVLYPSYRGCQNKLMLHREA